MWDDENLTDEQFIQKLANKKTKIRNLSAVNNFLTTVPDIISTQNKLEILELDYNQITSITEKLPDSIWDLSLEHNNLSFLPNHLPSKLKVLRIAYNIFSKIDYLPNGLRELFAENNMIEHLPRRLPSNLKLLFINNNRLSEIISWSNKLDTIKCSNNLLVSLPDYWPPKLIDCNISNNNLTRLPETFPSGLKFFYCSDNLLTFIPRLPENCHRFNCQNNPLVEVPRLSYGLQYYNDLEFIDTRDLKLQQFNSRITSFGWKPKSTFPSKELWKYVDMWYDNKDKMLSDYAEKLQYMDFKPTGIVPTLEEYNEIEEAWKYRVGGEKYAAGKNWQSSILAQSLLSTNLSLRDIASISGWTDPLLIADQEVEYIKKGKTPKYMDLATLDFGMQDVSEEMKSAEN